MKRPLSFPRVRGMPESTRNEFPRWRVTPNNCNYFTSDQYPQLVLGGRDSCKRHCLSRIYRAVSHFRQVCSRGAQRAKAHHDWALCLNRIFSRSFIQRTAMFGYFCGPGYVRYVSILVVSGVPVTHEVFSRTSKQGPRPFVKGGNFRAQRI